MAPSARRDLVLYDTTLRDGAAREGINLSVGDKVRIAKRLAAFGIPYIEGGYAGSNPKDMAFFKEMKRRGPGRGSKLVAFGSTRRKNARVRSDAGVGALLDAGTKAVCLFGKASRFQVEVALGTSKKENLAMIGDTVKYLVDKGREVLFDAEHFFDGYHDDADYALAALAAARDAGASYLVLCDTNGGTLPSTVGRDVRAVAEAGFSRLGIHTHNDAGCAEANSIAAVEAGAVMVQGTINGYGERTGNADLITMTPTFELKMGKKCLPARRLERLAEVSRFVAEVANVSRDNHQPYVGRSAFAHKGGAHGSAVRRDARTYEHVEPQLVGNERRLVVSEIAGRAMVADRLDRLGISLSKSKLKKVIEMVKQKEHEGWSYEAADASLDLILLEEARKMRRFFRLESYHVSLYRRTETDGILDATVKIAVNGKRYLNAAEGNGPVHALDQALRGSLEPLFPEIKQIRLLDFKVRVLEGTAASASVVRVLIESGDGHGTWGTVGVNENIIKASWDALYDSIEYGLYRAYKRRK